VRRRIAKAIALTVAVLAVVVVTAWGALALYYLAPASEGVRRGLGWIVAALGMALVTALLAGRWRVPAALAFGAGLAVAAVAWTGARPSNTRDWQPT
jgi:hypothetical protein